MTEFLFEIFSEEIPARMQDNAANDIKNLIVKGLKDKSLSFDSVEAHSTPRRIVVVVNGLPKKQDDITVEKRGPRVDANEKAIAGFLRANNLSNTNECVKKETKKGEFWFYINDVKGVATEVVLADILDEMFKTFVWPKSMRWKTSERSWVRPLHSIIALFDGKTIPFSLEIGGDEPAIVSSSTTRGHRFLSDNEITVTNFADYKEKLKNAYVLVDREDRKQIIEKQSKELAKEKGLNLKEDKKLLEEIVGLVEWPVPLICEFEKDFLEVPSEILLSTMRKDQKYMGLLTSDKKLSNNFIVVANTETKDNGKMVIAGNEKVVRARLADAKFFWDQDKKHKLESRNKDLADITFHKKLGTVAEKVTRLESISGKIAETLGFNAELATRAATLCKSDLVSGVVYEFPEVQGIMGRYYAINDGESEQVANAISDHYKPIGANDDCPTESISICIALADKIDTLVGFFAINEKPTGSKDPFALRRATLGIIRILIDNKIDISLEEIFKFAYNLYADSLDNIEAMDIVLDDLFKFLCDRLKVSLKDKNISYDILDAVFANMDKNYNVYEIYQLAFSLTEFLSSDNGANLITAYKRAANILRIEEKKDKKSFTAENLQLEQLKETAEQSLNKVLSDITEQISKDFANKNFNDCMNKLAELRAPVDSFFDDIMVNDETFRENRLCLLAKLRNTMSIVADFSKVR